MVRLYFFLIAFLLPAQAFALAGNWSQDDDVSARLISGVDNAASSTVPLGLELNLSDGWHTYWRSPGAAGLPPQFDWSRSQTPQGNLKSATLLYPAPQRYSAYGLETVGYRGHIVFPIDAVPANPGQPLHLDAGLDLLVCSSICVPKHVDLKLDIPAGTNAAPSAEAPLIKQFRDRLPTDPDNAGLLLQGIANDSQSLIFTITSRDDLIDPDIFIEDNANIAFGAPQVRIDHTGHRATLRVMPADTLPQGTTLEGMKLTLTITNGNQAIEIKSIAPGISQAPPSPAPAPVPFKLALWFALIGGLILNLMPCVLPVLSLKILSVISHGGGSSGKVRQSFIVTAAGIIFSFLVLASFTTALKNAGLAFGWGVQFQQPAFVLFLTLLLLFFAANLWDLFEIPLPRFIADNIDKAYHPKLAGDFLTGAFATMLATPCTAPFLGTAIGFALTSGTSDIFAIFTTLGFGMALPYIAVALFPSLATVLPKPGPWMAKLRHFLGCALAATAAWMVWILAAQITAIYTAIIGVILAAILIFLILKKHGLKKGLKDLGTPEIGAIVLVLLLIGLLVPRHTNEPHRWIPWKPNGLAADLAEGKTVFLDVTADWCLTCKANMRFVLTRGPVKHRLFESDVVAMQADWTNPDPMITELLHTYGRYGIPFNVVYGPRAPQGIVLPELLTTEKVLKALDDAGASPP